MSSDLVNTKNVQAFLDRISGVDQEKGDARLKKIVRRIVSDLFEVIDEHDVSAEEFWRALNFLQQSAPEFGLWAPGFGFDHYLDLRMDEADKANGRNVGTPRTIEGPLYVPGAPIETGFARLDDGSEDGEVLIMQGQVTDLDGAPIPGAVVDVWHANIQGNYSHFDPSQSDYNNRRRIKADDTGRYKFRSLVPSGYSVPPGSGIEKALDAIGRHGSRPAHIHFFVSAPGRRHLTTQINIAGDPFLYDDFAFATHEELIPEVVRVEDAGELKQEGLNTRFSRIEFNFVLPEASGAADGEVVWRARAPGV